MVTVPTFTKKSQYWYRVPRLSILFPLAFWKKPFNFTISMSKFVSAMRHGPFSKRAKQLRGYSELCITYISLAACPETIAKQQKTISFFSETKKIVTSVTPLSLFQSTWFYYIIFIWFFLHKRFDGCWWFMQVKCNYVIQLLQTLF